MKVQRRASLYSVAMALMVVWLCFNLLVLFYGEAPREMLLVLLEGTWGTGYGAGQVLFKATPLLFAGLAVDVAFRAGLFNVGAEGQIMMASLAVAALGGHLPMATPSVVAVPLLVGLAMAVGALWAFLPAWLKVRFGAHEVISTIMMNRLAGTMVSVALGMGLALPGTARTANLVPGGTLSRLDAFVPAFRGSAASMAAVVALVVTLLVGWALRRVVVAREMALVGLAPKPCAAEHIPVGLRTMQALVLSGAVAGMASLATVMGYKGYYEDGLGAGVGFGGIAVALLGQRKPLGLVAAALMFGTLQQGGLVLNAHLPMEAMDVLQGVVVLVMALTEGRMREALSLRAHRENVEGAPS